MVVDYIAPAVYIAPAEGGIYRIDQKGNVTVILAPSSSASRHKMHARQTGLGQVGGVADTLNRKAYLQVMYADWYIVNLDTFAYAKAPDASDGVIIKLLFL